MSVIARYKKNKCSMDIKLPDESINARLIADKAITSDKLAFSFETSDSIISSLANALVLAEAEDISGGGIPSSILFHNVLDLTLTRVNSSKVFLVGAIEFYDGTIFSGKQTVKIYKNGSEVFTIGDGYSYWSDWFSTLSFLYVDSEAQGMDIFSLRVRVWPTWDTGTLQYAKATMQAMAVA